MISSRRIDRVFCRFSDDNWSCDAFVFTHRRTDDPISPSTYKACVAGNRIRDTPPPGEEDAKNFVKTAKRINIDLPNAGQTFEFDNAYELYSFLRELVSLGYNIPEAAIIQIEQLAIEQSDF